MVHCDGPWAVGLLHGGAVAALAVVLIEQEHHELGWRGTQLSTSLLRPVTAPRRWPQRSGWSGPAGTPGSSRSACPPGAIWAAGSRCCGYDRSTGWSQPRIRRCRRTSHHPTSRRRWPRPAVHHPRPQLHGARNRDPGAGRCLRRGARLVPPAPGSGARSGPVALARAAAPSTSAAASARRPMATDDHLRRRRPPAQPAAGPGRSVGADGVGPALAARRHQARRIRALGSLSSIGSARQHLVLTPVR